jgi:hypothetical protein
VLAYTDCLVLDGGRTPDSVFDALRAHLSDEEILELTYITCMYDMHAVMCRALRLEFDDVDERVVEGRAGDASNDVMSMVDRAAGSATEVRRIPCSPRALGSAPALRGARDPSVAGALVSFFRGDL